MTEPTMFFPMPPPLAYDQRKTSMLTDREVSTTFTAQRVCSTRSSFSSFSESDKQLKNTVCTEDFESTSHSDSPSLIQSFSYRWLIYLPLLFIIANGAAYAVLFWFLRTLNDMKNASLLSNASSSTSNGKADENLLVLESDSSSSFQVMANLCAALYNEHSPGACIDPPAPLASPSLDVPSTGSAQSTRMNIALLSGALAFLLGTTVALLAVDLFLHVHVLKMQQNQVRQKTSEEEQLAELKAGWTLTTPPLGGDNKGGRRCGGKCLIRRFMAHFVKRPSCSATVLSIKRWAFSRLFMIVPIWVPLTEHMPRWEFALLQALLGLFVGGIIHRRSRWEAVWND